MAAQAEATRDAIIEQKGHECAQKCRFCRAYLTAADTMTLDMLCNICTQCLGPDKTSWSAVQAPVHVHATQLLTMGYGSYTTHFDVPGPCIACFRIGYLNGAGGCLSCTFPDSLWDLVAKVSCASDRDIADRSPSQPETPLPPLSEHA
jgi:hypothetical protein